MRTWIIAVLVLGALFYAVSARADHGITPFNIPSDSLTDGLPVSAVTHDPYPGKQFGETWTLTGMTDSGWMIFAQLIVSSTGLSNFFPGYSLTIISPDGIAVIETAEFESEELIAADEHVYVQFGPALLKGTHPRYHLRIDADRISCDLLITAQGPGFMAGDGKVNFDNGRFMKVSWPAPDARIEGTLTMDGKPVNASGWADLDHLVQNILGPIFAESWTSLHVHANDLDIIVFGFEAKKSYGRKPIYLALVCEGGRNLAATTDVIVDKRDYAVEAYSGRSIPRRIEVRADGAEFGMSFFFGGDYVIHRFIVLEKLNPITAGIVKRLVANPIYIRTYSKVILHLEMNGVSRTTPAQVLGQFIYMH